MTTIDHNREAQGETLAVLLERLGGRAFQALELDRLLGIISRICDVAASAHRCGLMHGNLEPGSVRVGRRDQVYVADARLVIRCEHSASTGAYDTLVTPAYMAPEQAWGRRKDFDARTDVYAIGGMLYAILTRTAPHQGGSASADLALAKCGTVSAPHDVCPERPLPPALCRIALRALSANPSDRHPSVEVLKHDIERFLLARQPAPQAAFA